MATRVCRISYLIPYWVEVVSINLCEIFAYVLIGQIATQESTVNQAIVVTHFIQSTGRFVSLKQLIKPCTDKHNRYLKSIEYPTLEVETG